MTKIFESVLGSFSHQNQLWRLTDDELEILHVEIAEREMPTTALRDRRSRVQAVVDVWFAWAHPNGAPKLEPKERKPRERSSAIDDSARIRVLAEKNPKSPGSRAHRAFDAMKDGTTVGEYRALAPALGFDANAELRFNVKKGFVRLETA